MALVATKIRPSTSVADPYNLIRIRIQDLKKFVKDPYPDQDQTLKRIQAKTIRIRIRIQAKKDSHQENIKNLKKTVCLPCLVCLHVYYILYYNYHVFIYCI